MSNTQNNSMIASRFYMVSAVTKNIKHLYYQVIQNSCTILTYNNPEWFCSVPSGISMLLPLGPTHNWCSNASTAFHLQGCEREESELSSPPPSPLTAWLFCLHLGKTQEWSQVNSKVRQREVEVASDWRQTLHAGSQSLHCTLYQRFKLDIVLLVYFLCYIIHIFLSISVRGNKHDRRDICCAD